MDDTRDLVKKQFGEHADNYATSPVHAQGVTLQWLVGFTHPQKDWVVLDVSTGAGHTALAFAPLVARVIATDLTPQMLETAQRLASERGITNIEFKPADAQALPFPDNTFDAVTSRLALHHYPDAQQAIMEMTRVCRSGGYVALADNIVPPDKPLAGYINHFEKVRDPSHNWAYPAARLQAYFEQAGLKVEHTDTVVKDMEFDQWAERQGATAEVRAKLRKLLMDAPEGVKEFLKPHIEGDKTLFSLTEFVVVGKKGQP